MKSFSIGGAGALLAKCIKKAELIAYEDLGAEALRKLYVEDMPYLLSSTAKEITCTMKDVKLIWIHRINKSYGGGL